MSHILPHVVYNTDGDVVEETAIHARSMPVELGCGGFERHSLSKAYGTLSTKGASKRRAINNDVDVAEKISRWRWLKRVDQ